MREVDFRRLGTEYLDATTGVFVAFFEGLEGCDRLAAEAEGAGYGGPVEFEGCAALGSVSLGRVEDWVVGLKECWNELLGDQLSCREEWGMLGGEYVLRRPFLGCY